MVRLVAAGVTLRGQVDKRWPDRDRSADGWVGDAAHQARASDHNPTPAGWVHAIDIDKDGIDADALADQLVAYCRARRPGSERVKNIVFRGRVASGTYSGTFWQWRNQASLGHYGHIHISFTAQAQRDGTPFPLPCLSLYPPPAKWHPGQRPLGWGSDGPQVASIQRSLRVKVTGIYDQATRDALGPTKGRGYLPRHPWAWGRDGFRRGVVGQYSYASLMKKYPT